MRSADGTLRDNVKETNIKKKDITISKGRLESIIHQYAYGLQRIRYRNSKRFAQGCTPSHGYQEEYFGYIPLSYTISTLRLFEHVYYYLHKKYHCKVLTFCDAGCGVGNIMLLAENAGFSVYGVEIDKSTARLAQCIIGADNTIKIENIIKHDFSKYDIVYYYCPIRKRSLEEKFEKHLCDSLHVGGCVIPVGSIRVITDDKRFMRVNLGDGIGSIFEKSLK